MKQNRKLPNLDVENRIIAQIEAERSPVTALQFAQYQKNVDFVINLLQQQIISLDVTCSLMMEQSNLTDEQRTAFKDEVGKRVKAIADDMVRKQHEHGKKSFIVQ